MPRKSKESTKKSTEAGSSTVAESSTLPESKRVKHQAAAQDTVTASVQEATTSSNRGKERKTPVLKQKWIEAYNYRWLITLAVLTVVIGAILPFTPAGALVAMIPGVVATGAALAGLNALLFAGLFAAAWALDRLAARGFNAFLNRGKDQDDGLAEHTSLLKFALVKLFSNLSNNWSEDNLITRFSKRVDLFKLMQRNAEPSIAVLATMLIGIGLAFAPAFGFAGIVGLALPTTVAGFFAGAMLNIVVGAVVLAPIAYVMSRGSGNDGNPGANADAANNPAANQPVTTGADHHSSKTSPADSNELKADADADADTSAGNQAVTIYPAPTGNPAAAVELDAVKNADNQDSIGQQIPPAAAPSEGEEDVYGASV